MTPPILVTGGTGNLGGRVVARLRADGVAVRVLSRTARPASSGTTAGPEFVVGDLNTGAGLDAALVGVRTVVHCAGDAAGDEARARVLVDAAAAAGVTHLLNVSVVGADRVPVRSRIDRAMFSYFAEKRGAELVVAGSGVPWTNLRATQFHDLALTVAQAMARLPVVPVPAGTPFQPVDVAEVAARVAELATGAPVGLAPDVAGPEVLDVGVMVRTYLAAVGRRRPVLPVRLPGAGARALRAGAIVAPDRAVGRRTWADFLHETAPARR